MQNGTKVTLKTAQNTPNPTNRALPKATVKAPHQTTRKEPMDVTPQRSKPEIAKPGPTKMSLSGNKSAFAKIYANTALSPLVTRKRQLCAAPRKIKIIRCRTTKRCRLISIKTTARVIGIRQRLFSAKRVLRKPSVAFVPDVLRSDSDSKLTPYALRARRTRKKLKNVLPAKQNPLIQQKRALFRQFIGTRMLFVTPNTPQLATVRKANKMQFAANPLRSGHVFDKNSVELYEKRNYLKTTNNYLQSEKKQLRATEVLTQTNYDLLRTRFIQRWHSLPRTSRGKKRSWKSVLKQRAWRVRRLSHRVRRAKGVQARRSTKKVQKRTRAAVRNVCSRAKVRRRAVRTSHRQQLRFRSETFAATARQYHKHAVGQRSAPTHPAVLAELQYKTRRVAAGRLHGVTLKSRRRRRKSFFRLKTKRNVNIRRRRWFKQAVIRARRRKRPATAKPWHPRQTRRFKKIWAHTAFKKAKLRGRRKLIPTERSARKSALVRRARSAHARKQRRVSATRRLHVPGLLGALLSRRVPAKSVPLSTPQKRNIEKTALAQVPYFAVTYRLKSRLRKRRNRKGLTKKEQAGWKAVNRQQLAKALKVQRARQNKYATQKGRLRPLKVHAPVTRAERLRRRIQSIRRNRGKARLRRKRCVGFPSTVGVTRRRRVSVSVGNRHTQGKRRFLHNTTLQIVKNLRALDRHRAPVRALRMQSVKLSRPSHTRPRHPSSSATRTTAWNNRESLKTQAHRTAELKVSDISTFRARFPAAGRTKDTFDGVLKKEYTRRAPLQPRQKKTKHALPAADALLTTANIRHPYTVEMRAILRHSAATAKKHSIQPFVSQTGRKSVAHKVNVTTVGKFYFLKSAAKAQEKAQRLLRNRKPAVAGTYSGAVEALVQQALVNRRLTRRARKLKLLGRKNSRGYAVKARPFWLKWRHAKKQRRAHTANRYAMPGDARFSRPAINKWTMNELTTNLTRLRTQTEQAHTALGEALVPSPALRRARKLEYKLRQLQNKKRRLHALAGLHRQRRGLRLKKKVVHRTTRRLREVFSRFWRHKKRELRGLELWGIRKQYRLERRNKRKLKQRLGYRKSLRQAVVGSIRSLLAQVADEKEKAKMEERLSAPLTPLHFRKPAQFTTASAEENKKWQQHVRTVRKQRYKRLAESAEALTTTMPRLISLILEKTKNSRTQEQCSRAVISTYWNLRLLLLQARRGNSSKYIEAAREKVDLLKKEMATRAEDRFFTDNDVKNTRYRFQPYTITRAPSLQRGADGWLDQFLPQYYDLLLEAPEKYGHFRMTPIQVFRAQPSVDAVRTWETKPNPSTMEAQYKRLTNGSYGRSSNRFETMLMTNRRHPLINGYGASDEAQVLSPVGSATKKISFFKRSFSTASCSAMLSTRLLTEGRTTETASNQAAAALLRHYKSLKERAVAKAQLNYISEFSLESAGDLDPRLSRRKSPRSGEFLERAAYRTVITGETAAVKYREYTENTENHTLRATRSTRRVQLVKNEDRVPVLKKIRADAISRRTASFMQTFKQNAEQQYVGTTQRRLSDGYYRTGFDVQSTPRKTTKIVVVNKYSVSMKTTRLRKNLARRTAQSAAAATPTLPAAAFQIKRQLRNRARKVALGARIRGKLWNTAGLNKRAPAHQAKSIFTPRRSKMKLSYLTVRANRKKAALSEHVFTTAPKQKRFTRLLPGAEIISIAGHQKRAIHKNFVKGLSEVRRVASKINFAIKKRLARERASLWAARRKELWHQLTHKWMKKRRILRRWLKGIKRSFKEKTHWTFEGEHALPEELFKLSRIRLRKLTWKKSDGRFEYPGLKKQLTLRPAEKRNIPWIEGMLYSRALYSTQRMAIRRHQLPKDMKSKKWLQRAKKQLFKKPVTHLYIRKRQWPRLRMYNQRLQRSLLKIRNTKAAVKRVQKLARRTTKNKVGSDAFAKGNLNRLDVSLVLLNFAPTTFWARVMVRTGLFHINGAVRARPSARLAPEDIVSWDHGALARFKEYFKAPLKRWDNKKEQGLAITELAFPSHFAYNTRLGYATYLRHPTPDDLKTNSRIGGLLFKWFRLDSRAGK